MSRKIWYSIIVVAIVIAFVITTFSISNARKNENEQSLIHELSQLRNTVLIYQKTFHKNPTSLQQALNEKYAFPIPKWEFGRNEAGDPVDAFGNLFVYDSQTGQIHTSTESYLDW